MNVIWIVADTFRQDHLGAYGNPYIRTPSLDALAARSVRFDRHYAAGFPTMPTRADHATGRWTMSFMGWEPLSRDVETLAELLARSGFHTAASVDTPFYLRGGMNYDRGFQTFFAYPGQSLADVEVLPRGREARDARAAWRFESDRNVAQTVTKAMRWLELHSKEDFFLYIDTWDPHEPWDAPTYYTELYLPGYDGEVVRPTYGYWRDEPGYTEERVATAHATYCGEVTMVDTWVGYLLRLVENMGLMENTAIIFTSDHGFYFGEHGGLFGKMTLARQADGTLYEGGDRWDFCPALRGGGEDTAAHLRAGRRTRHIRRVDLGGGRHAHRPGDDGPREAGMGRGYVPAVADVGPGGARPGLHRYDHPLCQRGRPGALGGRLSPVADACAGHDRNGPRLVAGLQPRRGPLGTIQPAVGPVAGAKRHRHPDGNGHGRSPPARRIHAGDHGPGPPAYTQAGAAHLAFCPRE